MTASWQGCKACSRCGAESEFDKMATVRQSIYRTRQAQSYSAALCMQAKTGTMVSTIGTHRRITTKCYKWLKRARARLSEKKKRSGNNLSARCALMCVRWCRRARNALQESTLRAKREAFESSIPVDTTVSTALAQNDAALAEIMAQIPQVARAAPPPTGPWTPPLPRSILPQSPEPPRGCQCQLARGAPEVRGAQI